MTIVKATLEHLPSIVPLFDGYRVFYRQSSDVINAELFLKERLEKNDTVIFLAFDDNEAVGFTQLFHSFSSVSMQPLFILNDLFVAPKHRKKGYGVALLEKAKAYCIEQNYKGLVLQTEKDNPAQKLYEHLGWELDPDLHYGWYK